MSDLQLTGFEVLERIGGGGMATVWKARQLSLDRVVAIKILRTRLAHDPDDLQRFQMEAQSAAKLKHPGIVQVYDARAEFGLYYFVMEYIEGYTAGEWLRRKGVLPEKDVLLLADCVADALQYAWNKEQIIHCDVKPENIMVDADGTVKVADLGLARTISMMTSESPSDDILGTPAYMSPEQAAGEAQLDFRTDIYSLGAMLYHLLTGTMLFQGHTEEEVMAMQIEAAVPDPIEGKPKLSRGVCWLLEKMLAKDRNDRHENWEAVRADLDRVRRRMMPLVKGLPAGRSTLARSPRRTKVGLSDRVRHPTPSVLSTLIPMVAVVGVAAALAWSALHGLKVRDGRLQFDWTAADHTLLAPWAQQRAPAATSPPPAVATTVTAAPPSVVRTNPVAPPPVAPKAAVKPADLYEEAARWTAQHPDDFDAAIERFRQVAVQTAPTPYARMAEEAAARVAAARTAVAAQVLGDLKQKAEALAVADKFEDAIRLYENYAGARAAETADARGECARALRERQQKAEDDKLKREWQHDAALKTALTDVVAEALAGRYRSAADVAGAAGRNPDLTETWPALRRLKGVLDGAAHLDEKVLASFREQRGTEVAVQLTTGRVKAEIVEVTDSQIECLERRNVGSATSSRRLVFGLADLAPRERLARMGAEDDPSVALAAGVQAMNARSYDSAKKTFWIVDPLIAQRLVARVEEMEQKTPAP